VIIFYIYAILAILLTGVGQVLLKMGARNNKTYLSMYLNLATLTGYGLFLITTVCAIYALQVMDLKLLYALMSLSHGVVLILSSLVLKEEISRNKAIAVGLIIIGIIVFNL